MKKIASIFLIFLFALLIFPRGAFAVDWYNVSWDYRVKITVQNGKVDADVTDFPVYVNLNNLPAGFHTNVNQTDARDIRVTKSDGTTELPREVVFYTAASDTGELHFKADSVANATDTDFYIYYGNAGASDYAATDTYGRNNVWDSNHKMVLHLKDATTSTITDSTSNGNNGTKVGANEPVEADAKIYKGQDFDGSNDYISNGTGASIKDLVKAAAATFSFWIYPDAKDNMIMLRNDNNGSAGFWIENLQTTPSLGAAGLRLIVIFSTTNLRAGVASPSNGAWTKVDIVYPGDSVAANVLIYFNGVLQTQTTTISPVGSQTTDSAETFYLGNKRPTSNHGITFSTLNGKLDEVNISNSARASTWISTQYNNQSDTSTFYAAGAEENAPVAGGVITTWNGIATSSVATINGVSTASIGTWNGITW